MSTGGSLERTLRFHDVFLFGVGSMLGAGIYAIVGEATALAGNQLWLSLLVAAGVALCTAFTYAELASAFPSAGGGYTYLKEAFGSRVASVGAVVLLLTGVVAAAAISIAFAEYLGRLVDAPPWVSVAGVIGVVAVVNTLGAGESSTFNSVATVATIAGLAAVCAAGLPGVGSVDLLEAPPGGASGVLAGAALAFFSYVGFEDLVKLGEETERPERTLPRALVASALLVTVIYALVAVAAVSAMPHAELAASKGPMAAILTSQWGAWAGTAIVAVALAATSKTILTNVLGASRLVMSIARDHTALAPLARISDQFGTPVPAIALIAATTLGFAMVGDLGLVATLSNFCVMAAFISMNVALIKLRLDRPDLAPPFSVPLRIGRFPVLPAVAIVLLIGLAVANATNLSS